VEGMFLRQNGAGVFLDADCRCFFRFFSCCVYKLSILCLHLCQVSFCLKIVQKMLILKN